MQKLEKDLVKEQDEFERICESLTDIIQPFQDQINKKQEEQKPWLDLINEKEAQVEVRKSERDILVQKAEDVKAATADAEASLRELQEGQESKIQQLNDLKKRKQSLQADTARARKNFDESKAAVEAAKNRARTGRARIDDVRASQAQSTSQNKVLDSLNNLSRQGRIQGFYGRLGGLGKIDSKYDVAISTACGQLHHMVVDHVEQGQTCIEYLRKQNVGRASFMVLDKLGTPAGMKASMPLPLPRLFDLVEPKDPKFAPAFFKALNNTLVATTLEEANRVAVGGRTRYRVVTLEGELVDISGTMSGGGNHKARGAMSDKFAGEKFTPQEIQRFEEECQLANNALEEALGEYTRAEAELEALQRSGPEIDLAINKLTMDVSNTANRIKEAEKRLRELKAQSKPDAGDMARIKALDGEIKSVQGELDDLRERSAVIQQAIEVLRDDIGRAGGSRMYKQKSTVDGLKLLINIASEEIIKAEVARDRAKKDAEKLEKVLENHKASLEESEAELKALEGQLREVTEQVTDLRGRVEEAQTTAETSKEELDRLKVDLQEKTEQIDGFRKKELELQQKIDDIKKMAKENTDQMAHWEAKHEGLELEDVDEDDEEDNGPEAEAEGEGAEGEEGGDDEPPVKVKNEEDQGEGPSKVKPAREKTPPNELKIFSERQLAEFDKRQLMANVELVDGESFSFCHV
ncbi:hypothetical protein OF83DRAFT_592772 [Amylostereum chailletii]|nr:hypothetical protein OF83DRAFT_592772 [Amylostereum chailletii]